MNRCDYPVDDDDRRCGAPADWHTDDLAEIHHLCLEHRDEALMMNGFRSEPISR